jgi:hypothetical protein
MAAQALVAFGCQDKLLCETWEDLGRASNLANFPAPFRMLLIGPPGGGKSMAIKNLIVHADPPYQEIYVIHEDARATREYDDVEPTAMMEDVPGLEFWDSLPSVDNDGQPYKRLVVVDDLEATSATRERNKNLAILLRYASSHKGLSVCLAHQSYFDLKPIVKKLSSIVLLWRPRARNELALIENRTGLEKGALTAVFDELGRDARDFITIDHTRGSPAPMRWGLWQPLTLE